MNPAIKVAAETEDGLLLDINLVPFGGLFNGRDLDGEFFTARTDLCLDFNPAKQWPLLYQHGHDGEIRTAVLGTFGEPAKKADGFWVQAQIEAHNEYLAAIKELVAKGALFASSGALNYLVETKADGEISRWPLMEGSLTPTPANLLARVTAGLVEKRFKSAGLEVPAEIKAVWSTAFVNDLPDSAFLYIEPGGEKDEDGKTTPRSKRHFPYKDDKGKVDLPHLRNALARIPQSSLADDIKQKVLAKAKRIAKANGIDVADDGKAAPPYFQPVAQRRLGTLPQPTRRGMSQDTDGYTTYSGERVPGVTDSRLRAPRSAGDVDYEMDENGMTAQPTRSAKFYGDIEGSYEDLIDDICCALNMGRGFDWGPGWVSVQATFPEYAIVKVYGYGDDDEDLYRVPYTLDEEGEPVLGQAERVQIEFSPAADSGEELKTAPLALHIASVYKNSVALAERTKDLRQRRAKEGRVLSNATRQRLQTLVDAIKDSVSDVEDLLTTTEPPAKADGQLVRALELKHRHYQHLMEAIA